MSDFFGSGFGIYTGTVQGGFTYPKTHLFIGSKLAVSNVESAEFSTNVYAGFGVILVSPTDGSTGIPSPTTLTWGAMFEVVQYQIQIATDVQFENIVRTLETSDAFIVVPNLSDGKYYWRVRYR